MSFLRFCKGFCVFCTFANSTPSSLEECREPRVCVAPSQKSLEGDRGSLLQVAMKSTAKQERLGLVGFAEDPSEDKPTCSPLKNQGSHFTVTVEVGTPAQEFDLVADTGSNAVIVASCVCQDRFMCDTTDRCFRGANRSTSFMIDYRIENGTTLPKSMLSIRFGSGVVETAVASDIVKVGSKKTNMSRSLLLMVGKILQFSGPFEGILGLGLPKSDLSRRKKDDDTPTIGGFLETAQVPRFSVCFNPAKQGVLRLSQARAAEQLSAVGKSHWALSYSGYSLGDDSSATSACANLAKQENKSLRCVGIPDSGTTLIMAPGSHIVSLFADLCSRWPRCQKVMGDSQDAENRSRAFQHLLLDCNNYTSDSHGLDEDLPPLHFHLAGSNGKRRKLTLPGASYVYETMEDEMEYVHKNLFGIFPVDVPVPTGKKKRVCTPAFGAMNMSLYPGPVWILGQPIFYEFQVGYEMSSETPSISFTKESCGSCENGEVKNDPVSLVSQRRAGVRRPVLVRGPARLPSFDFYQP